jgi:hypothetical protein
MAPVARRQEHRSQRPGGSNPGAVGRRQSNAIRKPRCESLPPPARAHTARVPHLHYRDETQALKTPGRTAGVTRSRPGGKKRRTSWIAFDCLGGCITRRRPCRHLPAVRQRPLLDPGLAGIAIVDYCGYNGKESSREKMQRKTCME